ncbi:MAG: hypothetical protein HGJ94_18395 [Desulfosarcina sp.]|nr:hypothetical protein [Desulfosarcina sp.]
MNRFFLYLESRNRKPIPFRLHRIIFLIGDTLSDHMAGGLTGGSSIWRGK